jgi:excisionase family DNA binding protein
MYDACDDSVGGGRDTFSLDQMGERVTQDQPARAQAEPLLHVEDVARLVGMTPKWIYDESRKGRIPHIKLGRYYRYRESSISRWLASKEAGGEIRGYVVAA